MSMNAVEPLARQPEDDSRYKVKFDYSCNTTAKSLVCSLTELVVAT